MAAISGKVVQHVLVAHCCQQNRQLSITQYRHNPCIRRKLAWSFFPFSPFSKSLCEKPLEGFHIVVDAGNCAGGFFSAPNPGRFRCNCEGNGTVVSSRRRLSLHLPTRCHFASFTLQSVAINDASSEPSASPQLTSTVGSPSSIHPVHWTLTHRHIQFLTFVACTAAISATWLFCSAIPTLLAFKRAAESLEKLMDTTKDELPDTMAAVRLSGMEISDLTMELSDLGQEITQGVRSSTRAVRLAEERLRRLTNMNPIVSVQVAVPTKTQIAEPVLARIARGTREGIVKGRAILQMFLTLTRYSKILLNYLTSRTKA